MKPVESSGAPKPIGPYSQAVVEGGFVFVAGMVGLDPATGKMVEGGVREQTARALASLKSVLEKAGTSPKKVTKTTVYIKDGAFFKDMNEVYAGFFGDHRPARTTVVTGFPREDILVEIDAIAGT